MLKFESSKSRVSTVYRLSMRRVDKISYTHNCDEYGICQLYGSVQLLGPSDVMTTQGIGF